MLPQNVVKKYFCLQFLCDFPNVKKKCSVMNSNLPLSGTVNMKLIFCHNSPSPDLKRQCPLPGSNCFDLFPYPISYCYY